MKTQNRFIAAALSLLLTLGIFSQSAFADAWVPSGMDTNDGSMVAAITERADYQGVSRRTKMERRDDGTYDSYICAEGPTTSGACARDANTNQYSNDAILPVCLNDASTDCVEAFEYGPVGSQLTAAKLVKEVDGQKYPALSSFGGVPAGGTISIWNAPGLANSAGSTKYVVHVHEASNMWEGSSTFTPESISAFIMPISDRSGPQYKTAKLTENNDPVSGRTSIGGWEFSDGCAVTEAGYCGVLEEFSPNSRFALTLRVSNKITGWFRGRIQKPNVEITKFSDTSNRIKMTAEPVAVPRLAAVLTAENTTEAGQKLLTNAMGYGSRELFKGKTLRHTFPDSTQSISWVEQFRKAANDTAAAISTAWDFATLSTQGSAVNNCMADKSRVVGVVTTNATAFSEGTPDFTGGMLEYKVAGLHYAPDGKALNEGSYDLIMRSDVARCLYGFSSAPVSAKISVISDAGESKVATTVVSEKDGWLKMAAYGFTFSSPTIKVKLTQAGKKVTTITCIKGKSIKKVTSVNPKCPAGFKKK